MADDDETGGRTVRVYDRPADADKVKPPIMMIVLGVAVLVLVALLLARFVFHAFGHPVHAGMISPIPFTTEISPAALIRLAA